MINANDIGIPIDKEFWYYLLNFGNDWKRTEAYFCTFKKILICVESENSWNGRLARARDRSDKQA